MLFEGYWKKKEEKKNGEADVTFKPYEEPVTEAVTEPAPVEEEPKKNGASLVADAMDFDGSNIELKVVRPAVFDEVSDIADYLLSGCTVVLNLELLDEVSTNNMLYFLNGVTYCTDGEIENVSNSTYVVTPRNVNVSRDK